MSIQGIIPLATIDSITSIVSAGAVISVGIYLAKSFMRFKDDILVAMAEIKTELSGSDGNGGLRNEIAMLRELKHEVPSIKQAIQLQAEAIKDHEDRLRYLERSPVTSKDKS